MDDIEIEPKSIDPKFCITVSPAIYRILSDPKYKIYSYMVVPLYLPCTDDLCKAMEFVYGPRQRVVYDAESFGPVFIQCNGQSCLLNDVLLTGTNKCFSITTTIKTRMRWDIYSKSWIKLALKRLIRGFGCDNCKIRYSLTVPIKHCDNCQDLKEQLRTEIENLKIPEQSIVINYKRFFSSDN